MTLPFFRSLLLTNVAQKQLERRIPPIVPIPFPRAFFNVSRSLYVFVSLRPFYIFLNSEPIALRTCLEFGAYETTGVLSASTGSFIEIVELANIPRTRSGELWDMWCEHRVEFLMFLLCLSDITFVFCSSGTEGRLMRIFKNFSSQKRLEWTGGTYTGN